eukprot:8904720-Karenia_brevis.AAC.1
MRSEAYEALVQQQRQFDSVAQSFETEVRDVDSVELAKERTELKAAAHREKRDEANQIATPSIQRLDAVNAELRQNRSNIENLL